MKIIEMAKEGKVVVIGSRSSINRIQPKNPEDAKKVVVVAVG